jgi:imidazolonepropionase-like amidohydrolase
MRNPDRQLVTAGHYVQLAVVAGVSTLRDCGTEDFTVLALRDAICNRQFVGPRILSCGWPITTMAGHICSDWGVDSAEAEIDTIEHCSRIEADP